MKSRFLLQLLLPVLLGFSGSAQTPIKFDSGTVSGLPARNIGSAQMSGRIAALAGVKEEGRTTLYVGSASGGVWKSVDGGSNFRSIFDREPVQSIGAIAIDPANPKNIWVGTGESWIRNSASMGDGIYKSTDGGDNWTNARSGGLRAHRQNSDRPQRRKHGLRLRYRTRLQRQP